MLSAPRRGFVVSWAGMDTYLNVAGVFSPGAVFNGPGASAYAFPFRDRDDADYFTQSRGVLELDARTQTDFGTLRSYFRSGMDRNTQSGPWGRPRHRTLSRTCLHAAGRVYLRLYPSRSSIPASAFGAGAGSAMVFKPLLNVENLERRQNQVPMSFAALRLWAASAIRRRSRHTCRSCSALSGRRARRSASTVSSTGPAQSTRCHWLGEMPA